MADTTLPLLTATEALADTTIILVRRAAETSDEKATLTSLLTYVNDGLTIPSAATDISLDPEGLTYVDAIQLQEAIADLDTAIGAIDPDDLDDAATTNKFTTVGDISKLSGIETGATADQTGAEIKTAYEAEADTNAFTDAEESKLSGIEASADVTDATNVNAAGAVMETDYNAHTILAATADDTPAALTVGEQTLVGRITEGNIAALSATQVRTLLNVEDGATAGGSGGGGLPVPYTLATDRLYLSPYMAYPFDTLASDALATKRVFYIPVSFPANCTIDRVGVQVSTAVNGNRVEVALYEDDGDGSPGDLVSECGTFDTTNTGTKIATGLGISVTGGALYHFAVYDNNTSIKLNGQDQGVKYWTGSDDFSISSGHPYSVDGLTIDPASGAPYLWPDPAAARDLTYDHNPSAGCPWVFFGLGEPE